MMFNLFLTMACTIWGNTQRLKAAVVCLVLTAAVSSAQADFIFQPPVFLAQTAHGTRFIEDSPVTSVGSFAIDNPTQPYSTAGSEFAQAGAGFLRSSSEFVLSFGGETGLSGVGTQAESNAYFQLNDLIITGGTPGELISGTVNFNVSGGYGSAISTNDPLIGGGHTQTQVYFSASVTSFNGPGFSLDGSINASVESDGSGSLTTTGIFNDFDGDASIKSEPFLLRVGVPIQFTMSLQTIVGAFGVTHDNKAQIDVNASGLADFAHTVSFATDGPVFDLPDGYTVNSVQGQIVDNRWVGAAASAVPEPSSLLLLAIGGFGIAGCYLRGRKLAARAA